MNQPLQASYNTKAKSKAKSKNILVEQILETLCELKSDFLELKKIK